MAVAPSGTVTGYRTHMRAERPNTYWFLIALGAALSV